MAWLGDTWRRRIPISVVTDSTDATEDVTVSVPAGWDEFWTGIDTSGYNIRLTAADGVTALNYAWSGFSKTNKTGTLQIDGATMPALANRCVLFWLYYRPQADQTDGATSVTIAAALTGYLDLGRPDPTSVVLLGRQRPGATSPTNRIAKPADAESFVWLEFTRLLQASRTEYNGRQSFEEPSVANVAVLDDAGSGVASMTTDADMRWTTCYEGGRERIYLRLRLRAGTSGEPYTLVGEFTTATPDSSAHRVVQERVGVSVLDQLET